MIPDERLKLLQEVTQTSPAEASAYLLGTVHDATWSTLHRTTRFSQIDRGWLEVVGSLLLKVHGRSWIYKEGRDRRVWVLETTWQPPGVALGTSREETAYVRGYFDAEGGIPRTTEARFYIQFTQKDRADLDHVRQLLAKSQIACGRLHNPSHRVDPDYWRFFVCAGSHRNFIEDIGSWHPRKRKLLEARIRRLPVCSSLGLLDR